MPNPPILYVKIGSVGHRITVPMDQSLSGYTGATIEAIDPLGASHTWAASVDATNNVVYYLLTSGDLDEIGTWTLTGRSTKTGFSIFSRPMLLHAY